MQCLSWETSENFERIKIRKFIIKKFVCSINSNIKRVNISITEKYEALQKTEEGKSTKKSVSEEYGVKTNTISTWIANKK